VAQSKEGGDKKMVERLVDMEVTEDGTVTEEIELICTMTGFRRRFLVHHIGEGFFRSLELEAGQAKEWKEDLCEVRVP
jgi:hypothetical protein